MAHLVLPDTKTNASQNSKSHFLPTPGQADRIIIIQTFFIPKNEIIKMKILF